jgi:hypothetical protein
MADEKKEIKIDATVIVQQNSVEEKIPENKTSKKDKAKKKSKRKIRKERRDKEKTNDWAYSLTECCGYDAGIGFNFLLCFPCSISQLVEDLREDKQKEEPEGCCKSTCCCFCLSAQARQLGLNRFRIKDQGLIREFCKSCCCACCSGAQVKNQLEYQRHRDKNAPREQKMDDKKAKKPKKKQKDDDSSSSSEDDSDSD